VSTGGGFFARWSTVVEGEVHVKNQVLKREVDFVVLLIDDWSSDDQIVNDVVELCGEKVGFEDEIVYSLSSAYLQKITKRGWARSV
jgi:hypothetical protein